jgi:hypothetical protein
LGETIGRCQNQLSILTCVKVQIKRAYRFNFCKPLVFLVGRIGIEPITY